MSYLLEFLLISFCLYAYYRLFLQRQPWLQFNRLYLLLLLPLSALLAQIDWALTVPGALIPAWELTPILIEEGGKMLAETSAGYRGSLVEWIYGLGMGISLVLLLSRIVRLWQFIRQARQEQKEDHTLVLTNAPWSPASFFRYVFWNPETAIPARNQSQILAHELCHVRQGHSYDQLLMELFQCVLWFFPLVYVLRRDLIQTHEFLADKEASRQSDAHAYAHLLLSRSLGVEQRALTHSFFRSPIKNRIFMLTQSWSKWTSLRYAGLLPVLVLVFAVFSCQAVSEETTDLKRIDKVENSDANARLAQVNVSDDPAKMAMIEVDSEPKVLNLPELVGKIGYPEKAKKEGIEGMVVVKVLVGEKGEYLQHEVLKDPDPSLTQEVEKYLTDLKMEPATKDGKPVKFWVSIPFKFKLK